MCAGDLSRVRRLVREAYSAAATTPAACHPFPVGREFAASLGYPAESLASLPAASVEAFSGVSTVSLLAEIQPGATVLDVGCGAGLDSLIAARRVGPHGRVIGLDFSADMLARARAAVAEAGIPQVCFALAAAECLPLPDASIDAAMVNGIFNLNPARTSIFNELARVLRPGGAVWVAELVLSQPLPPQPQIMSDWFA